MYQVRTLKALNALPALMATAMVANCNVASAQASLNFSYPSGFAGAGAAINTSADAKLVGSAYQLLQTGAGHAAGAIWYTTQQNVTAGFTTQFTFQYNPAVGLVPTTAGITFCVQNTQSAANPLAYGASYSGDANVAGYGAYNPADGSSQYPPINSIAVKFDINNPAGNAFRAGGSPNSTGLYINGGTFAGLMPYDDLAPYGINFYSGDIFQANIVYDGSLLTLVLRDTTTGAQARQVWPVNIPFSTSSNLNWVGFTGGGVNLSGAVQVDTWSFWTGYNTRLATPTFSVTPGQYASTQTVSISAPSGATVYYTTNGLEPTSASPQYTGAITVSANETIQAVAIESGYTDSLVAVGAYQIGTANLVNFPSGFAPNDGVTLVGHAVLSGSQIQLTDTNSAGLEAGAAWWATPVNVQSFTTVFTMQETSASANGMTFAIQNSPSAYKSNSAAASWSGGPNVIGGSQSAMGYGGQQITGGSAGILNSIAVAFDLYNVPNSVGLYTNGATPTGSQVAITGGLNIASGHPIQVTLTYSGTTLSLSMLDTVNSDTFSYSWTVNIPSVVGGNTAYVGFTGATGGGFANQYVQAWTYAGSGQTSTAPAPTVPAPAVPDAPTNLTVQ